MDKSWDFDQFWNSCRDETCQEYRSIKVLHYSGAVPQVIISPQRRNISRVANFPESSLLYSEEENNINRGKRILKIESRDVVIVL